MIAENPTNPLKNHFVCGILSRYYYTNTLKKSAVSKRTSREKPAGVRLLFCGIGVSLWSGGGEKK